MLCDEQTEDLVLYPYPEEEDHLFSSDDNAFPEGSSLSEALLTLVEPLSEHTQQPLTSWPCFLRYKTELCSRYAETGNCKYARKCQFAHGLQELRVPSRHPKYKTELCRSFHTAGFCQYGVRCLFIHNLEERRDPDEQKQPISKYKTEPCRTFLLFGICPYGSRCNFIHVEDNGEARPQLPAESPTTSSFTPGKGRPTFQSWKNRPSVACRNFAAFGFCLYGNRCRFQHNLEKRHLELMPTAESSDYYLNYPCLIQTRSRAASPVSDEASSTSVTPDYRDDSPSPGPVDKQANNAFSFSDLLLPLTWRLQDLENGHQGLTPESDVFNL
ncbi:cysteine three histidine 1 [Polypterus senegalus]|uniref:cysteine three histidine 1 n=1 Tax=Polypterus senegalus TaxID=55291 RepID=UPI001966B97A|nr:cysteine three histidine 1 [Polypterus senegalus]